MKEIIKNNKINLILDIADKNDGYITTNIITKNKIHREYLNEMQKMDLIEKVVRGVYILKGKKIDEIYALSLKNPKIIYSELTSLYLLEYIEKIDNYDIVVDANYHDEVLSKKYHVVKCSKNILEIGLIKTKTKTGKEVNCYNIERTICDLIKFKKRYDFKLIKEIINKYMKKEKNIERLYEYAEKLRVLKDLKRIIALHID